MQFQKLVLVLAAFACWGQDRPVSPEVAPDGRVTFRLRAARASEVKLWGEWILKPGATEALSRGSDGVWSATVGPLEPGLYSYVFLMDGVAVLDSGNPLVQTGVEGASASLVEVPGVAMEQVRAVPHGVLHTHRVGTRKVIVYTPPGYDPKRRYPVLVLMHGSGDTESAWTQVGRADVIADNLLAEGRMRPMLIAMPNGHGDGASKAVVEEVLPLLERTYSVVKGPRGRAVAGLSMGAFQALSIAMAYPERFGNVGLFSGGVWGAEGVAEVDGWARDKRRPDGVFYIAVGGRDRNVSLSRKLDAVLESHGVRRTFRVAEEAGHTWRFWRSSLAEFLPLLFR